MFTSVVLRCRTVGFYCDLILGGTVCYCQLSCRCCDLIVLCLRILIQLVCECVVAASGDQLAACDFIGCAFAFRESVTCDSDFVVR